MPVRLPVTVSAWRTSTPAASAWSRSWRPGGSSPTAVMSVTSTPSRARFSATFRATPPGDMRNSPGADDRGTRAVSGRPITSITELPMTTTPPAPLGASLASESAGWRDIALHSGRRFDRGSQAMIVAHAPSDPNRGSWPAPVKTGTADIRRPDATIALVLAWGYSYNTKGNPGVAECADDHTTGRTSACSHQPFAGDPQDGLGGPGRPERSDGLVRADRSAGGLGPRRGDVGGGGADRRAGPVRDRWGDLAICHGPRFPPAAPDGLPQP